MAFSLQRLARGARKVARNPILAARVLWPRVFPFAMKPRDPQAYRIGSWGFGSLEREPLEAVFPGAQSVDIEIRRALDRKAGMSLDPLEVFVLAAIVRVGDPKRVLEIGTYDGNTALNLAANTSVDAVIHTVDLPPDWDGAFAIDVPDLVVNAVPTEEVGIQFKGSALESKIDQIYADSAELDWSRYAPLDLVFIDGCHFYDYVKLDTENALTHTRRGGLVVWHDYGMIEDVSRVVDEVSEGLRVRAIQGTRLAVGFP